MLSDCAQRKTNPNSEMIESVCRFTSDDCRRNVSGAAIYISVDRRPLMFAVGMADRP